MSAATASGSRNRSCSSVPQRTSGAVYGLRPEPGHQRADQQRLHQRHLRVRRHLEAAQLEQPEPAALGVGAEQLVDAELGAVGVAGDVGEQVPEQPVDVPGAYVVTEPRELGEGDLQLVERLRAALVDPRRLAGRADEAAGEQVGQRRVVLPVGQQADEQVGAAQQRAVGRGGPAEGQVVAAAGAGVAAVDGERLGAKPLQPRVLVDRGHDVDQLRPARRTAAR